MKAPRPQLLAALVILTCWVGCTQSSSQPSAASPMAPLPEPEQCKSDADCAAGMVCTPTIHAACETCDGGKVIHVCQTP